MFRVSTLHFSAGRPEGHQAGLLRPQPDQHARLPDHRQLPVRAGQAVAQEERQLQDQRHPRPEAALLLQRLQQGLDPHHRRGERPLLRRGSVLQP